MMTIFHLLIYIIKLRRTADSSVRAYKTPLTVLTYTNSEIVMVLGTTAFQIVQYSVIIILTGNRFCSFLDVPHTIFPLWVCDDEAIGCLIQRTLHVVINCGGSDSSSIWTEEIHGKIGNQEFLIVGFIIYFFFSFQKGDGKP